MLTGRSYATPISSHLRTDAMNKRRRRAVRMPAIGIGHSYGYPRRPVPPEDLRVLAAEVVEFLGRVAGVVGKSAGSYRVATRSQGLGYGSTPGAIRRPRVRRSNVPAESEILPPCKRGSPELDKTLHELWLRGLSTRDCEPSLRALPGCRLRRSRASTTSSSTIIGLGRAARSPRSTCISGPTASTWLPPPRASVGAVIGVGVNGNKELLALEDAFGESAKSWTVVFESLLAIVGSRTSPCWLPTVRRASGEPFQPSFRAPSRSGAGCTRCATRL